jgi:hypothetical protein
MQRILPSVFADSNVPIGIITYDDRVSCYEITPSLTNPKIAIMPDIHTPTPPSTTTSLLQPYSLAKSNIDKLLDLIPQIVCY